MGHDEEQGFVVVEGGEETQAGCFWNDVGPAGGGTGEPQWPSSKAVLHISFR